ncbi:hypothetical protein EK21DRAFT_93478 [Setomelanomma holmii]|uniref:Heterokaryon incompatibility domain-containing protein n=1 Tax=Setomelanomma holmii TaxID=210430 RepID=A0A9P4H109_9PLEO|nr:hypothetical protein EK21DRAFT_93478 [Setomelanomma holmii]
MEPEAGNQSFVYEPLPNPQTHFRLIKFLQGGFGQSVARELSVRPIYGAPPYAAVSYTWGDPQSTPVILVDGKEMTVRANCERTEGIHEKNYQVALMGIIYSKASRSTPAWVLMQTTAPTSSTSLLGDLPPYRTPLST